MSSRVIKFFNLCLLGFMSVAFAQTEPPAPASTEPPAQTITYDPAPVTEPLPIPAEPVPATEPTPQTMTPTVAAPTSAPAPTQNTTPANTTPEKPVPLKKPLPEKPLPTKPTTSKNTILELVFDGKETIIQNGKLVAEQNKQIFKLSPQNIVAGAPGQNSERRMAAWLKNLEHPASAANWVSENDQWIARQRSGVAIDRAATRANVLAAIKNKTPSANVVYKTTQPKRNIQQWFDMGIRNHFGGGTSNFYGSRSFRVTNILNGVSKINGTYIAAGQTFDFNRAVGATTPENGFVKGYIIQNGNLAKDFGGGICQVSTTMFRAAYNSGLPILQRNFHSYRVHFYDPIGYEATVFAPSKNLKFTNDTNTPLFIQASWNVRTGMLSFHFFGPASDRRAVISNPYIYNRKAPGVARFIADEEIALGRSRRVDNPEQGMDVIIYRTVYMNSGAVRKDQTRSRYIPWGAIFAVNPRDWRAGKDMNQLAAGPYRSNNTGLRTGTTGLRTGTGTGSTRTTYRTRTSSPNRR